MRIKEEIKRVGEFWLPSSPERRISGTLSISDGGNIKLELAQSFDPSIQAQLGPTHPDSLSPILGHVEKDGPVRIDQCYRVSKDRNITHGRLMAPLVIWANRAFMGLPYEEEASPRFNSFSFSVEGIDEWVGITGIDVDEQRIEEGSLTISYNRPADISISFANGMQLLITFAWTPPGFPRAKRAEVSQKTFFKLISKDPCEIDTFISIAQKIAAFLCFVMNEIVCLDEMSATSNSYPKEIADGGTDPIRVKIYCASWPYAKNEPAIDERNMLFKYKDKQNCVESLINKWIENYEQIAPALDLYFLTKAGTLPTLNMQFLALAQALEAFHLRTSNEKHMDKAECREICEKMIEACPEEHRDWFRPKLQRANELTLQNRIETLFEPFDCLVDDARRPQLIKYIKNTRNYLTHYDPKLEKKAAKGTVLEVLCLKMNGLFRLQFLKLIGFDEQEIDDIVDKCTSLKVECSL